MAMSIFWRAKVVRNLIAVVLTIATTQIHAQSSHTARITYNCKSTNLETVINDLSKLAGVNFVYSSDKIVTSTPVSLSIKDKPLNEVLAVIGKQLNLSFKIQDQHITIKPIGVLSSPRLAEAIVANKALAPKANEADKEPLATTKPYVPMYSEKMERAAELSADQSDVSQYTVKLSPYFNPATFRNVPISYIKSTSRKMSTHRWFVAAGPVINNYSAGVEVHAGLQKLYAVLSPGWMLNDQFHGAFGIGTTLQFSNALSLKPIYTYASLKSSSTASGVRRMVNTPTYDINTSTSHHQLKLMLEYAVTKKISFRAGPTFNLSKSVTKYDPVETRTYGNGGFSQGAPSGGPAYGPRNFEFHQPLQVPSDVTTDKYWIGWEAAFAYRINF